VYDLIIRGGTIVDGTGAASFRGDLAISQGKIVAVGTVSGSARQVIDGSERIVAPGFIDQHTHYDAQIFWDPYLSSSSWHGITSVIAGNCGFTLAPCKPQDREYISHMLAVVEDMSLAALEAGLSWDWEDFTSFVTTLERRPKAINIGFYVGHSTLRRYVMGADFRRAATESETASMQNVVFDAINAGALGWSSSRISAHVDGEGKSVPSFYADTSELLALARALRKTGRGVIEVAPTLAQPRGEFETGDLEDMRVLAETAARPVTFAPVRHVPSYPGRANFILSETSRIMAREGVRLFPQIGFRPMEMHLSWHKLLPLFAPLPAWRKVMFLPAHEIPAALRDPAERAAMRNELERATIFPGWHNVFVEKARGPEHKELWEGKSVADIASAAGQECLDTFFDISAADDCDTEFVCHYADNEVQFVSQMMKDPNVLLGTDAGAHLSSICNADLPTGLISRWVRDLGALSIEEAVLRITSRPADVFGLTDRGRLKPGYAADVVVFNLPEIACFPARLVHDLPANQARLVRDVQGIDYVIVNGQVVFADNKPTGTIPGQILRAT
jgi:N-acyl-D-amino-acid deacylase